MTQNSFETPLVADLGQAMPDQRLRDVRVGVITFPGTLDDRDAMRAVEIAGGTPVRLWHADDDLQGVDAVILPGGFSYGDYLRAGAISRFAPLMTRLIDAANGGLPILGICNGFQVLTEAHLLPGSMIRNDHLKFVCRDQRLRVESTDTPWTSLYQPREEIVVPLKNQDGQYVCDDDTLRMLEEEGRVVFRYLDGNPNGSRHDIAGVRNAAGNVVGLMPHPEHAIEPGFGPDSSAAGTVPMRGGADGLAIFVSALTSIVNGGSRA